MNVNILYSKLHKATVTGADLEYEGSITIDKNLMDAANFIPNQQVDIYNITNGERMTTYVIEGQAGSKTIQINGAGARKASIGDKIIIVAYAEMELEKAKTWQPTVVLLNGDNSVKH